MPEFKITRALPLLFLIALIAGIVPGINSYLHCATLRVGPGQDYADPELAAAAAEPGDTILIYPGTWDRTYFIEDLKGLANEWIVIRGTGFGETIMGGGTESLHFINCSWIILENLIFERNTGNGVNIDDGGDYNTPTHHFIIRDCIFRNMNATGNNDFLKLSGLDSFEVIQCLFMDGAAGGSGIDMVGCHWGLIADNDFYRLGSNSIQAKGGTRYITITRNYFEDGGLRAMNLGGSTGEQFFRPLGVNYEASDLEVIANITTGSDAPVAFVSSQDVRVWNNTFFLPDRWVMRILQESGDTSFFLPASNGEFINNLIVVDNSLRTTVNIGPLTRPETFRFSNNLWWDITDPGFTPSLPNPDPEQIIGLDPLMTDPQGGDFTLQSVSPAIKQGATLFRSYTDIEGNDYLDPPSIGAYEGGIPTSIIDVRRNVTNSFYPNPASDHVIWNSTIHSEKTSLTIFDQLGRPVYHTAQFEPVVNIGQLSSGHYFWVVRDPSGLEKGKLIISH